MTVVGAFISVSLIVSAIIIKQKKLNNHKVNVSEEIAEYASIASVELRSTAIPAPPPKRMPGTNVETYATVSVDPEVDKNPAYGQATGQM